ncbi:hypothetical protein SE92_06140 [Bradyrhizobium sp. AT1]|nr:hypothetical protein SE92_06140 [Bradyrhizobium sp. AT1]
MGNGMAERTPGKPEHRAASENDACRQTRVFISYSRKDLTFAETLVTSLVALGFEAYLDKKDILPGELWRERLTALIARADAVVFLISPDSVLPTSVCDWELNETERMGKRLLPVVMRRTENAPSRLSRLNWIFMDAGEVLEPGLNTLASALMRDIAWIREHTRIGELAFHWANARNKDEHALLRGKDIDDAELWISSQPSLSPETPEVTADQRAFIQESRRAEQAQAQRTRQQLDRTAWFQRWFGRALAGVGVLLLAGLAGVIWQDIETTRREQTVFVNPVDTAVREQRYDRAMRYALQTFPAEGAMPWIPISTAIEGKLAGAALANQLSFATVGHAGPVRTAKFSPDGKQFVTASDDGEARIWNVGTGSQAVVLRGHTERVVSAEFSSNGRRIVTASADKTARLWDAATGNQIGVLSGTNRGVHSARFNPDGTRVVTASGDGTVRIWDAATAKELAVQKAPDGFSSLGTAAFSADGKHVVSTWGDGARVWNMASDSDPVRFSDGSVVHYAGFSPDSAKVLVGYAALGTPADNAALWDVETGTEKLKLDGSSDLRCAAFSPDGKTIAGCVGKSVRLWDADSGQMKLELKGHAGAVSALAFSGDGRLLASGSASDGNRSAAMVMSFSFIPLPPGSDDVRIWDMERGEELADLRSHTGGITDVSFSPEGDYVLSASDDGTARVWLAQPNFTRAILIGHEKGVVSAAFNPEGSRIVTGSDDGTARVWDVATAKELLKFSGHGRDSFEGIKSVAFSSDGKSIVSTAVDNTGRIWDAVTGSERIVLAGPEKGKHTTPNAPMAAFSPDDTRVVTAGMGPNAYLWDAKSGTQIAVMEGQVGLSHAAFSPDSKLLLLVNSPTLRDNVASPRPRLFDGQTGKMIRSLPFDIGGVVAVAFSSDGQRILAGYARAPARVFDLETGASVSVLKGYEGFVTNVAFSPDGTRIVTASADETARLWDTESGEEIVALRGHHDWVTDAQFSRDGARLVTTSRDGTAIVRDVAKATLVKGEKLRAHVCNDVLTGVQEFSDAELADPFLRSLDKADPVARNPCLRRGPLHWEYYTQAAARWGRWARKQQVVIPKPAPAPVPQ